MKSYGEDELLLNHFDLAGEKSVHHLPANWHVFVYASRTLESPLIAVPETRNAYRPRARVTAQDETTKMYYTRAGACGC